MLLLLDNSLVELISQYKPVIVPLTQVLIIPGLLDRRSFCTIGDILFCKKQYKRENSQKNIFLALNLNFDLDEKKDNYYFH
jgi:hypothetical protein